MMKDHEFRELVNELTDTAKKYGQMQQLRERIKGVLAGKVDPLRAKVAELEKDAAERTKTFSLKDIMDEYDKMSDDGAFEGADHPIVRMAGHIDALRAKVAELEKDAARYKWLRKGKGSEVLIGYPDSHSSVYIPDNDELDKAIDQARAKENHERSL